MNIIAYYLPQFHTFPENDVWWGKGFTEWTSVKKANPLFPNHYQPRVPLNDNYYNLTNSDVLRWQAQIAKQYGIYGFCYYHYWFEGKLLLEKPAEIMLGDSTIDLPFCMCWANHTWTKAWAKHSREVLIEQTYGDKTDWIAHFNYLLPFFKDNRYIKSDGKPVFVIYRPNEISELKSMLSLWNDLARKNGFDGLCFIYQHYDYSHLNDGAGYLFDYGIEFQPGKAKDKILNKKPRYIINKIENIVAEKLSLAPKKSTSLIYDYDEVWETIIKMDPEDEKMIPGAFVDFDNTPRYGRNAAIYYGASPKKFRKHLADLIKKAKNIYKKNCIFMFAWNEWGEGGYLEPDSRFEYGMLEAVKDALISVDEFPVYPRKKQVSNITIEATDSNDTKKK